MYKIATISLIFLTFFCPLHAMKHTFPDITSAIKPTIKRVKTSSRPRSDTDKFLINEALNKFSMNYSCLLCYARPHQECHESRKFYKKTEKLTRTIEGLIKAQKPLDEIDFIGETPLHKACRLGLKNIVQLLLRHGVLPNKLNSSQETSLDVAIYYDRPAIIELMWQKGALCNKKQITPITKPHCPSSINDLRKRIQPNLQIYVANATPLQKEIIQSFIDITPLI